MSKEVVQAEHRPRRRSRKDGRDTLVPSTVEIRTTIGQNAQRTDVVASARVYHRCVPTRPLVRLVQVAGVGA